MISIADVKKLISEQNVIFLEYLRKSRADSEFETLEQVLSRHEGILQDFMQKTFGIELPEADIYREVVSGETIDERVEIKKMFSRIEAGNVYAVVVVEPQRLTRGDLVDLGTVERIFKYTNTLIISPTKIYDLTDPFDLKLFRMELQQGSEYLEYSKMILTRGRVRSVEEGKFVFSTPTFGYNKVKLDRGFTLEPNDDADVVKDAFDFYLETGSIYETSRFITQRIGQEFTYIRTRNMLLNKIYAGYVSYGKSKSVKSVKEGKLITTRKDVDDYLEAKGLHQPLVTLEKFEEVQRKLAMSEPKVKASVELKHSLAGLIFCEKCGAKLKRKKNSNGVWALKCPNKQCDCISSKQDLIEDRLFTALAQELKSENRYIANYDEELLKEAKNIKKSIADKEKQIKKLEIKLDRVMDAYESGIYEKETFLLRSNTIKEEIKSLRNEIRASNFGQNSEKIQEIRKRIPILEECLKSYKDITPKERNELLKTFIERITYSKSERGAYNNSSADSFTLRIKFI